MTRLFEASPFIIAEVGSNWQTFQHAKDSIAMAKMCGADAVKFQAFTRESLYGQPPAYLGAEIEADVRQSEGELPLDWLPQLKEKADACGIEFMCTAFSPELVAAVDPFVEVHKIASSDLSHVRLLEAVAATGKPVLLSVGASSRGDIQAAVDHLRASGCQQIVLLYCNAAYPSRRHNLFLMEELRGLCGTPVGFSDHSLDVIYAPLSAAKTHGAIVIEKHFTGFPELETPDRGHSLTSDEFKIMVDYIRGKRDGGGLNPTSEERAMFLRHNRRLIVTKPVAAGEVLTYGENFGAFRSLQDDARGFSPFVLLDPKGTPEGRRATADLKPGASIGPGDYSDAAPKLTAAKKGRARSNRGLA